MSRLQQLLEAGRFVVTAEVGPPKGADASTIRHHAELLAPYVDALNVTDNQTAICRLSSIAGAFHVQAAGVEGVVQMTVRDRNRIALQSDLLGAWSLGLKNVLCLSGDHQTFGNHPTAANVYDIDSIQFIRGLQRLREGKFFNGEPLHGEPPQFFVGAVANPFADPFEYRVLRLEKKIRAGARFIQTQCIFDLERFDRFMQLVRQRGLHEQAFILAGVTPVKSVRMAEYMQKNVSGMIVPDALIQRLKQAENPKQEAVRVVVEQIQALRQIPGVRGVHIMAVAWEEVVPEIIIQSGLR
ncbi:5,10-methylenetetrahydrofolate reductase (ferredoxin) [Carboxydocella sporoproducens DSM 16521]|uniref:Methylenetetrahydrofolate reductase n=2 Tax=Carboxydocella TaxID=178898 RepID=A0A1T4N5U0_9FIRM|nr:MULTISPECIES: methylenetetrahydrofolate reductase [Carboxydocella]AVX20920.1 5,10-methylenetetrahydrofolate reductase subunit MetF [Carboxydocella thermautotrophica]SJZ74690.1 5,10-methylenetetrahydrofolate reductase (ferredoxin) [Carboxydocella sporoproducens DSM 16521]